MKPQVRWGCVFVTVAAVAVALAPAVWAADQFAVEGSFERTLKVTGAVDLTVNSASGSIQVRVGDAGSVHVYAKIRARDGGWRSTLSAEEKVKRLEANPPVVQQGNTIVVGRIDDEELKQNVSIQYELTVPGETKLKSGTGSGSQTIDGIRGPLEASTGSGSLVISNIGSRAVASTGSGRIDLQSVKGDLRASTGSGSIRGTGIAGSVYASTGSGDVDLEQTTQGSVEVSTGSGSIDLRGVRGSVRAETGSGSIAAEGVMTGEWRLETSSGRITVKLPANAAFELRAHASSGRVYSAHPVTMIGTVSPREMRGTVRGGGSLLSLSTSSGNIRIE